MDIKRVVLIVLDGVGIGEAPDAKDYGDEGSNSIGNISRAVGGLNLPNMGKIGIGNVIEIQGVPPESQPIGGYGKLTPKSAGKDTISGHWELMGICLPDPFPTYPDGFPNEIIDEFIRVSGRSGVLGNKHASGTEIIQELGEEHIRTGKPIVYTSADSVFQIAAHEDIIPIEELYKLSENARKILKGKHAVGRVIARPFVGDRAGEFARTERRKDFSLIPETPTVMDKLVAAGKDVFTVGKVDDIFGNRGITKKNHTGNNKDSLLAIQELLIEDFEGLLFANLIEFDMVYGHRNDPQGYAGALEFFDQSIPHIKEKMKPSDVVIVTADHGVDPTTPSTDHSREYVPLLVFGDDVKGVDLGTRETFSDVGATIAEIFSLEPPLLGTSFLKELS
jgi:phosphopentomutase